MPKTDILAHGSDAVQYNAQHGLNSNVNGNFFMIRSAGALRFAVA